MNFELANRSILNLLELASLKKEWIYTESRHRKLGKTKALIQFAKENDYLVVVPNNMVAKMYRRVHGYERVRSVRSTLWDGTPPIVFDEGCTKEQIESLDKFGVTVVTGFMKRNDFYDEIKPQSVNLLTIELEKETSVPRVFFKGEELGAKIKVSFDWETKTNEMGGVKFHAEHVSDICEPNSNVIGFKRGKFVLE